MADRLHPPGVLVLRGGGAPELLQVLRLRRRAPLLAAPVHARHPPHQLLLQARPHLLDLHLIWIVPKNVIINNKTCGVLISDREKTCPRLRSASMV